MLFQNKHDQEFWHRAPQQWGSMRLSLVMTNTSSVLSSVVAASSRISDLPFVLCFMLPAYLLSALSLEQGGGV